jgi:hypothetical protein
MGAEGGVEQAGASFDSMMASGVENLAGSMRFD